jgi:hypothetical protein
LFLAAAVTVFFTQAVLAASQTLEGDIYTIKIDTKDGKATVTIIVDPIAKTNFTLSQGGYFAG